MCVRHHADGISSRIIKLGTSSRTSSQKVIKNEFFETTEKFIKFMSFLYMLLAFP